MSTLEQIVNVQISRENSAVARQGFGILNILGVSKFSTNLAESFDDLTAVGLMFNTSAPEYIAASKIFAQNPVVSSLVISRRLTSDTAVVTVATITNSVVYTVTINGTAFTFTSDASATNLEIAAGLVAAINGGSEPVTATDNVDGTFDLVADVASTAYSLLTDTKMTVAYTTSQTIAQDIDDIIDENDTWYTIMETSKVLQTQKDVADKIETLKKFYIASSSDANIPGQSASTDVTTIAYYIKANAYARSAVLYHSTASTTHPEAGWLGTFLPLDPGSYTTEFKTISGIIADTFTGTQKTNLEAKYVSRYEEVASVSVTLGSKVGEGEWIDIIIFVDWLQSRMTEQIFGTLVSQPKVPYTDKGIGSIEADVRKILDEGILVGGIAETPAYTVTVPLEANVSAGDKSSRTLNNVKFTAKLAGAIHITNITGKVVP
jgi:hypothetical protein